MFVLPKIRDVLTVLSSACCPQKPGIKPIGNVHRTQPPRPADSTVQYFLQDNTGATIQDSGGENIYDDYHP